MFPDRYLFPEHDKQLLIPPALQVAQEPSQAKQSLPLVYFPAPQDATQVDPSLNCPDGHDKQLLASPALQVAQVESQSEQVVPDRYLFPEHDKQLLESPALQVAHETSQVRQLAAERYLFPEQDRQLFTADPLQVVHEASQLRQSVPLVYFPLPQNATQVFPSLNSLGAHVKQVSAVPLQVKHGL